MVVQACLSGVVKQSGSGPPSRQIFDSISIRTESPKPRGLVAWSEKYLQRKQSDERLDSDQGTCPLIEAVGPSSCKAACHFKYEIISQY